MADIEYPNLDPRLRPAEPDHPMSLEGDVISGDPALLVRCLAEEMLMGGMSGPELTALSHSPQYQSLYAARVSLGHEATDRILGEVFARVGVFSSEVWESPIQDETPVALTVSAPRRDGKGD
ncbi:MAG: hypothetical protein IPM33_11820 [Phycisphaerales bacterium]|jgi:hypothetical protein|nr:hypothetical protein [Phycisphaerales bacterium]